MLASMTAHQPPGPEALAKAFWELDTAGQIDFFKALAEEIDKTNSELPADRGIGASGEMQWYYVGESLQLVDNERARHVLMALAAPLYLHTIRASQRR